MASPSPPFDDQNLDGAQLVEYRQISLVEFLTTSQQSNFFFGASKMGQDTSLATASQRPKSDNNSNGSERRRQRSSSDMHITDVNRDLLKVIVSIVASRASYYSCSDRPPVWWGKREFREARNLYLTCRFMKKLVYECVENLCNIEFVYNYPEILSADTSVMLLKTALSLPSVTYLECCKGPALSAFIAGCGNIETMCLTTCPQVPLSEEAERSLGKSLRKCIVPPPDYYTGQQEFVSVSQVLLQGGGRSIQNLLISTFLYGPSMLFDIAQCCPSLVKLKIYGFRNLEDLTSQQKACVNEKVTISDAMEALLSQAQGLKELNFGTALTPGWVRDMIKCMIATRVHLDTFECVLNSAREIEELKDLLWADFAKSIDLGVLAREDNEITIALLQENLTSPHISSVCAYLQKEQLYEWRERFVLSLPSSSNVRISTIFDIF